jgi:tetratricopeptide (TPR) repeat protein
MAARLRNEGLRGERDALRLLAQTPSALQTAVALTDLYVERRAVTDLRRLADSLNHQSARPYVMAQLFVLNGQDQQALDTLAAVEFSGGAERQRLRLLAGLRQKAGQYAAAMEIYAALVAVSPDNVGDWLGLAVSADKGKLAGTALNAYEKVLLLRHPDQRVMQYARQRQQDLSLAAVNNR